LFKKYFQILCYKNTKKSVLIFHFPVLRLVNNCQKLWQVVFLEKSSLSIVCNNSGRQNINLNLEQNLVGIPIRLGKNKISETPTFLSTYYFISLPFYKYW